MNVLAMIQAILALAPQALAAYNELRSTLDADTQAEVDALIAQIRPLALAAEEQAVEHLRAAAEKSA